MNDVKVTEDYIGWDLKIPCAECPFRKSTPCEKKGIQDLPGLVDTMMTTGVIAHSCHRTDPRSDYANPKLINGKVQACAGFTLFALNSGYPTGPMMRAYSAGKLSIKKLRKYKPLAHSLDDLKEAYKEHLIKLGLWNV